MINITQSFRWSPDGYTITTITAGEHGELPARAVAVAADLGALSAKETQLITADNTGQPAPGKTPTQNKNRKK